MRYFALLYTPAAQRELMTAMLVVEAEIRASIQATHEVAHTRLQWWRAEIDRLVNRSAQHPATQVLQTALPHADFSLMHEFLVAADMDVARMTYSNSVELGHYLARSGGTLLRLVATEAEASSVGALIRRTETIRDLATDARDGRIYWPLDALDSANVTVEHLQSGKPSDAMLGLIANECARLSSAFAALSAPRPLMVLARLHARLIERIVRANYDVFARRHELGPFDKAWTAWLAARRS